jgi:hypothetical protein
VWRYLPGAGTDSLLAAEGPLTVGAYDAVQQTLPLSGTLQLPAGPAGSRDRLHVGLQATGDQLTATAIPGPATFAGTLTFASGLGVGVDSFTVTPLPPIYGAVGLVSSPAVNGGEPASFNFVLRYDSLTNHMLASYEDLQYAWQGTTHHLVVSVDGGLQPVVIFAGAGDLPALPAGVDTQVLVDVLPTGQLPGSAGERLDADVTVQFVGEPLRETGRVQLTRRVSLCRLPE